MEILLGDVLDEAMAAKVKDSGSEGSAEGVKGGAELGLDTWLTSDSPPLDSSPNGDGDPSLPDSSKGND